MKPTLTIAIPFYNNADTLSDAITSVLNQSYSDWELLLIDDGSTDDSLKIAKRFTDDRIVLIAGRQNKGLVERLNQSVKRASGTYYARMDADDIMHPERLDKQIQFLENNQDVDVVDTDLYIINRKGDLTGIRSRKPPLNWTIKSILTGNNLNHATIMGHIEWFRSNAYDPLYVRSEDLELWCRTVEKSVFARIQSPLYYVREGKINVANYKKSLKTTRRILKNYGRDIFCWQELNILILKSYLKAILYTILGLIGKQDILTNIRNHDIDKDAQNDAQEMLTKAISFHHGSLR